MKKKADGDLANTIIQVNSLMDSMWGIAKKVTFGAVAIALVATMVATYLGPLVSQRPWEFALLALLVLTVGFLLGFGAAALRYRKNIDEQVGVRDKEIAKLQEQLADPEAGAPSSDAPAGLSKLAKSVWERMEDADMRALGRLRALSLYNGEKPVWPLVLDLGLLPEAKMDSGQIERLARIGAIEKLDDRALFPLWKADKEGPVMEGVSMRDGELELQLFDGVFRTAPCTGQFGGGGADYLGPETKCVDLGIYRYTPEGMEVLRHVPTVPVGSVRQYIADAYKKKRIARRYFGIEPD